MIAWWLNGVAGAAVDPVDRGLHYGDGVFETLRVRDGRPRALERHLDRLSHGLGRLGIPPPARDILAAELQRAAACPSAGVVKLIVTRGAGGRGYRTPEHPQPMRLVAAYPAPGYLAQWSETGVAVRYCETRLAPQPRLAGLKHLNRLEQVLARAEWDTDLFDEGLMLDPEGRVVCGTLSNLFVVRDGRWRTPRVDRCGVAGTMRAALLAAAQEAGIDAREADLTPADLAGADEIFLSNAVAGAWPVRRIADRELAPGPAVRLAQQWVGTLR